jgi:FtsZ-interacting cell division protein ZipA
MSDLQVALIVLGGFIIAGVVIYNWMQERKLRNQVASEFIVPQKDVLVDDFHIDADAYLIDKDLAEVTEKIRRFEHSVSAKNRSETAVDKDSANNAAGLESAETKPITPHISEIAQEPIQPQLTELKATELQGLETNTVESRQSGEITQNEIAKKELEDELNQELQDDLKSEPIVKAALYDQTRRMPVSLPENMHPQIDLTAILYLTKNISGHDLSALINSIAGIGLPMSVYGLDSQDKWHLMSDSEAAVFKQVACSLQLADRGGPVAKNVLNKFQFAVEDAGLELNAHVEWQSSGDAMQRAIELDQFCMEVDQLISVHVADSEAPIHGTKFKGLAEASGMILNEDGKFHFYTNEILLFTATDLNNVPFTAESLRSSVLKGMTFQIEIPKVSNCEQVFNQMIMIAKKMASSLNANLVDDNQKQLGDIQIEKIRQQLKVIHATMVARGIMPGSPVSMRLFS